MTLGQFRAFLEHRSEEEKWELIDGVATMMAPPTIGHRRNAPNVERALNGVLEVARPAWSAEREVGIEIATFRREPDVTVVDTDIDTRPSCRSFLLRRRNPLEERYAGNCHEDHVLPVA